MNEQEAIAAIYSGKLVDCSKEEYPNIRKSIQEQAGKWIDTGQDIRASIALHEIKRLDNLYKEPK